MWRKKQDRGVIMRREGKYVLCTPEELAEYIVDVSFKFHGALMSNYDLTPYDFAVADDLYDSNELSLEEINGNSSGWYGIKQIDAGFEFQGIDLIADYYGGRCMLCGELEFDYSRAECVMVITEMIINVLNIQETCHEDTLLIAEPSE